MREREGDCPIHVSGLVDASVFGDGDAKSVSVSMNAREQSPENTLLSLRMLRGFLERSNF